MTNKEIKLSARKNISQNMGNCVSLTAFLFAVFVFLGLCELAISTKNLRTVHISKAAKGIMTMRSRNQNSLTET